MASPSRSGNEAARSAGATHPSGSPSVPPLHHQLDRRYAARRSSAAGVLRPNRGFVLADAAGAAASAGLCWPPPPSPAQCPHWRSCSPLCGARYARCRRPFKPRSARRRPSHSLTWARGWSTASAGRSPWHASWAATGWKSCWDGPAWGSLTGPPPHVRPPRGDQARSTMSRGVTGRNAALPRDWWMTHQLARVQARRAPTRRTRSQLRLPYYRPLFQCAYDAELRKFFDAHGDSAAPSVRADSFDRGGTGGKEAYGQTATAEACPRCRRLRAQPWRLRRWQHRRAASRRGLRRPRLPTLHGGSGW